MVFQTDQPSELWSSSGSSSDRFEKVKPGSKPQLAVQLTVVQQTEELTDIIFLNEVIFVPFSQTEDVTVINSDGLPSRKSDSIELSSFSRVVIPEPMLSVREPDPC